MRNIVNISMPASLRKEVEAYVEEGQYASISEFFRDMVRTWKRNTLLRGLRESQKEFRAGKAKKLTSFKDLR
ncbi:MAG: ribbon-helix-helix domain-containing protein [Candidatus Vogelbacteria bacterium]|nr:ribbon-helix-helix domain-containing protein [Candidatus Vogelbacteria bacterium]